MCRGERELFLGERGDLFSHGGARANALVRLGLELFDVAVVVLERGADLRLEGVDHHEVGEEGENVLDVEEWTLFQNASGFGDRE